MGEASEDHMFVGQRCRAVAKEPQQVARSVERVGYETGGDRGTNCMKLIFERSHHTEVSSATANGPEQIGFLVLVCLHDPAFCGDELDREKIVEGEAMFPHQPTQPAAKREP